MFSIEAIPCLTALPLQARLGLLFSFSAYLRFLSTASLRVETHWFPPLVAFTCAVQTSTGASRRANRGCLRLGWCCFPTPPSNRPRIVAQGRVLFSPQNELAPPPKGGGARFCSSLGFRVLLGSCLWQPLATTGSHGPNRAGLLLQWRRSPTRLS